MKSKRFLVSLALTLALLVSVLAPVGVVFAAPDANVTVTADPTYICIENTPNTWNLDSTGIEVDTIYYANPLGAETAPSATVVDAECRFTVTCCTGADTVDLTVTSGAFTGGSADMTNSDSDGSNGATTYGGFCWYSGMTYSAKVVMKSTGSSEMYSTGLAASATLKWGAEIETRTDAWGGGGASTATMTITATEH